MDNWYADDILASDSDNVCCTVLTGFEHINNGRVLGQEDGKGGFIPSLLIDIESIVRNYAYFGSSVEIKIRHDHRRVVLVPGQGLYIQQAGGSANHKREEEWRHGCSNRAYRTKPGAGMSSVTSLLVFT
tara:strand:- start:78 stop:464 length:387 start_codon:yes stop_codon:yes gene_type:complete